MRVVSTCAYVFLLLHSFTMAHVLYFYSLIAGVASLSCRDNLNCVPVTRCRLHEGGDLLFPCNNETENWVCCPDVDTARVVSRAPQFPKECGIPNDDYRVTGGYDAGLGQFPWMALLGYIQEGIDTPQFLCGGSLISTNFILTAAHCTTFDSLTLVTVRLGERKLSTDTDCEEFGNETVCSDPIQDVAVAKVTPHYGFNPATLKNDIALVKMKKNISFTEYIQPICLPFDINILPDMFYGKKFMISGWGKISSERLGGSDTLQWTSVKVWSDTNCSKSVPDEVRPIDVTQICANGKRSQDACKGDSGGPMFNVTVSGNAIRTFQLGIVSFASGVVCGISNLPTVYTRVDAFLDWIVQNAI